MLGGRPDGSAAPAVSVDVGSPPQGPEVRALDSRLEDNAVEDILDYSTCLLGEGSQSCWICQLTSIH